MAKHGRLMNPEDIKSKIQSVDKNSDGVIDKSEFIQIATKKIILNRLKENNYTWTNGWQLNCRGNWHVAATDMSLRIQISNSPSLKFIDNSPSIQKSIKLP